MTLAIMSSFALCMRTFSITTLSIIKLSTMVKLWYSAFTIFSIYNTKLFVLLSVDFFYCNGEYAYAECYDECCNAKIVFELLLEHFGNSCCIHLRRTNTLAYFNTLILMEKIKLGSAKMDRFPS